MATLRYRELERRLNKLRHRFLPKVFSPTGDYTDRQLDLARAYRLLVHAEIEAYLEDRAQQIVNECVALFMADSRPRHVLMNLLSFHLVQQPLSAERLKTIYGSNTQHCNESVNGAQTAFNRVLANNHGIREYNVLQILLPLGIQVTRIDGAWLSTLDTFGRNRGEVAHKSIKTHQLINPEDELKTTGLLLVGLKDIDEALAKLR